MRRVIPLYWSLLLLLGTFGCESDSEDTNNDASMSVCSPADPACALQDADRDGVLNSVDDFPLNPNCQTLSQENCTACGVGCPSGLFCARVEENGIFQGGKCEQAQPEVCNDVDDDGDGIIDEGPPADNQRGICGGSRKICGPSGGFIEPNYEALPNFVDGGELCDELDNDCDGLIDETPRALKTLGVCQGLVQVCIGSAFQEPNYDEVLNYSATELCDGLDNDCDGQVDEEILGQGDTCSLGVGSCQEVGEYVCDPLRQELVCNASFGTPRAESCNGRDDDCDGRIDENLPNTGTACTVGQGICAVEGTLICADESEVLICDAIPADPLPEACNGLDDDCDGSIDEDSIDVGATCEQGLGVCKRFGVLVCSGETNRLECDAVPSDPVDEVCNGVDDDCDGSIDEEIPTVGQGCTIGKGICVSSGALVCDPASGEVVCDAEVIEGRTETCNNVDDDCDDRVDEEAEGVDEVCTVGEGACARSAFFRCDSERQELVCDAEPGDASEESCNLTDDDCDGSVDEGNITDVDNFGIEWICVKGGDFLMGSNIRTNERPLHPVTVNTFEMSKTEVTVSHYRGCVETRNCPVPTSGDSNWNFVDRLEHPMNYLNVEEALNFASYANARLPSEAEWEFAARGRGLDIRYPWGGTEASCLEAHVSNQDGTGCGTETTAPVCTYPAGESTLGICDLSGNVWEWIIDGYLPNYFDAPDDGSPVLEGPNSTKLVRGGGFDLGADVATTTYRLERSPNLRLKHVGVRLVRDVSAD